MPTFEKRTIHFKFNASTTDRDIARTLEHILRLDGVLNTKCVSPASIFPNGEKINLLHMANTNGDVNACNIFAAIKKLHNIDHTYMPNGRKIACLDSYKI